MGLKWFHIFGFALVVILLALGSLPPEREYGIALSRSGRPRLAQEHLLPALKKAPGDRTLVREVSRMYTQLKMDSESVEVLRQYLKERPADLEIRLEVSDLYLAQKNLPAGIAVLEEAPTLSPGQQARLLSLYEESGDLTKAIALLKTQMDNTVADAERWRTIARFHTWQAQTHDAALAYEKAALLDGTEDDWVALVNHFAWLGDFDGAIRAIDALAAMDNVSTDSLRLVRDYRIRQRDLAATLQVAKRITERTDTVAQDFLDLGEVYLWSNRSADAYLAYQRGIKRYPDHEMLLRQGGYWAQQLGKRAEALVYIETLAQRTQGQAEWRMLAQLRYDGGDRAGAIALLKTQASRTDTQAQTIYLLTRFLIKENHDHATIKMWVDKAVVLAGDDPALLMEAVEYYDHLGEKEAEIATLNRLTKILKNDTGMAFRLAQVYATMGRIDDTRKLLAQLQTYATNDPVLLHREMANTLLLLLQSTDGLDPAQQLMLRKEALEAILLARKETGSTEWDEALIDLYLVMGKAADAEALMGDLAKQPATRILALTKVYVTLGENDRAQALLARIGDMTALSAGELSYAAYVYGEMGDRTRALQLMKLAYEKSPGTDSIYLGLADAYGAAGNIDEQYRMLDTRARNGNEQAWLDAADRRSWNNDPAAEVLVLEDALKNYPDSVLILARAAGAYARNKQPQKAQVCLARLQSLGQQSDVATLLVLAQTLAELQQFKDADLLYAQVLKRDPKNSAALAGQGYIKIARGQRMDALRLFRQYLRQVPEDAEVWYSLGEVQYDLGRSGAAAHRKVLRLMTNPTSARTWAMLARIHWRLGNKRVALHEMKRVFLLPATSPDPSLDMVDLLLGDNLTDEAEAALARLAGQYRQHRRWRQLRAAAHIQREEFNDAKPLLAGLLDEDPENGDLVADLAYVEDMLQQTRTAMRLYRRAQTLRLAGGHP